MTECTQPAFRFEAPKHRGIVARFDGGTISSDGGALLPAEVEQRTRIEHSARELAMQRVLGPCLGYEDLSDRDALAC